MVNAIFPVDWLARNSDVVIGFADAGPWLSMLAMVDVDEAGRIDSRIRLYRTRSASG